MNACDEYSIVGVFLWFASKVSEQILMALSDTRTRQRTFCRDCTVHNVSFVVGCDFSASYYTLSTIH